MNFFTPQVKEQCQSIYFRSSFIKDYLVCPAMSAYRWVMMMEETENFFASVLGTAGHEVIRYFHEFEKFDITYVDLRAYFRECYDEEMRASLIPPALHKGYNDFDEMFEAFAPQYLSWLHQYRGDDRNRNFKSIMNEQSFVVELGDSDNPDNPFIFTGQVDQAGFRDDGLFSIRDAKFRLDQYKPSRFELSLDPQFTVYNYGLAHGKPICKKCRPRYVTDIESVFPKLVYNGMCDSCVKDYEKWPKRYPDLSEMIWMRDYEVLEKDEQRRYLDASDKTKPKVRSDTSGRMVYQKQLNPKWEPGSRRKGEHKGEVIIATERSPARIDVLFADIISICKNIRAGNFHRRAGQHCSYMCKFKDRCFSGIETEIDSVIDWASKDFDADPSFDL